MNYWLIKSEPSVYSWDDLKADKKTSWDGVRNYAARNNLRLMKKDDQALYYHSNDGKEIVGIAKVSKEFYIDPTADSDVWSAVELVPLIALKNTVSLEEIKKMPDLSTMQLVVNSRLSVQPVTEKEFKKIIKMSEKTGKDQQSC